MKNILCFILPLVFMALAVLSILFMHPNKYPLWGAAYHVQQNVWDPLGHYRYADYVEIVVVEGESKELSDLIRDELMGRMPVLMSIENVGTTNMPKGLVNYSFKVYRRDCEEARSFLKNVISNYDCAATFNRR